MALTGEPLPAQRPNPLERLLLGVAGKANRRTT